MVSSTASSLIVLFIIASFLESISPVGESDMLGVSERDIFAPQMRYYLAMRDSDIFAFGECGRKYANINPHAAQFAAYRAAGISRF